MSKSMPFFLLNFFIRALLCVWFYYFMDSIYVNQRCRFSDKRKFESYR